MVFDVHQQAEVVREISTNDGFPNICDCECPAKSAPQTKIESEQSSSVRLYGCVVDCF